MKASLTLADAMRRPGRPEAVGTLAGPQRPETAAEEKAEPPVKCEPRLGRDAVLYQEPRPGLDGVQYFGACGSCRNFIPETAMRGAVAGARCALFGSTMPITDDASCNLYVAWGAGTPDDDIVEENAECIVGGVRGVVSPWSVGYSEVKSKCSNCASFDAEHMGCELFECLTECQPNIWLLDPNVKADGVCNLWNAEPPPPVGPLRP